MTEESTPTMENVQDNNKADDIQVTIENTTKDEIDNVQENEQVDDVRVTIKGTKDNEEGNGGGDDDDDDDVKDGETIKQDNEVESGKEALEPSVMSRVEDLKENQPVVEEKSETPNADVQASTTQPPTTPTFSTEVDDSKQPYMKLTNSEDEQEKAKCLGLSRQWLIFIISLLLAIPFSTAIIILYLNLVAYNNAGSSSTTNIDASVNVNIPNPSAEVGSSISIPTAAPVTQKVNIKGEPTSTPAPRPSPVPTKVLTIHDTPAPTTARFQQMVDVLSTLLVKPEFVVGADGTGMIASSTTLEDLLMDPKSPTYRAMHWLANDDPLQLPFDDTNELFVDGNTTTKVSYTLLQRYALATFYFATGGSVGGNGDVKEDGKWWKDDNWLSDTSICQWFGLECNNSGNDQSPHITGIILDGNDLVGSIPTEIGFITTLQMLSLSQNSLTGSIPDEIAKLSTGLLHLDLAYNSLIGSIPSTLGELTSLTWLWLWDNKINGIIPSEVGKLSTTLRYLSIAENSLSGTIPTELGALSMLETLMAYSNGLTGTLPTQLAKLGRLERFLMEENNLTGSIPVEMAGLTKLGWFSLNANNVTGDANAVFCSVDSNFETIDGSFSGLGYINVDCGGDNPEVTCDCCTNCG